MSSRYLEPLKKQGESKQWIILPEGLYVGFLQAYSKPFTPPPREGVVSPSTIRWFFLVTHSAFGKALPQPTCATKAINNESFYWDPQKNKSSNKFELYYTLTPREFRDRNALLDAAKTDLESIPDEDRLVGRPTILKIKPSTPKDQQAMRYNNIDGFMRLEDPELRERLKAFFPTLQFGQNEFGHRSIIFPQPIEEKYAMPTGGTSAQSEDSEDAPF